jgi:outer membrane immunogenic protein
MKRLLLVSMSLLGLATAPVVAADAPPDLTRQIIYAPPPPPAPAYNWAPPASASVYNWSACYIGGNFGGLWSSKTFNDPSGAATGVAGTDLGSHTASGAAGGGQIGCDYQAGWAVFGFQGLFDLANASSNNTWPLGLAFVNTTNIHWFSAMTGRIGFVAMPRVLVYAKGGGAWVGDDHTIQGPLGNAVLFTASPSRTGWTAGVGVEWGFAANWSVFAEYDYAGFGTSTVRFAPTTNFSGGAGLPINIQQNVNLFLVGLNVRFGPGPWTLNY